MKTYTGFQWLLIDAANQHGHDLDKLTFEERIQWTTDNYNRYAFDRAAFIAEADAKTRPLFIKAMMAIEKAKQGIPTGHMVGVDASCSGIQLMSALTGCHTGALHTGLIDPNVRADAYSTTTLFMQQELGPQFTVARGDAKQALMTSYYGSKLTPKNIFGEDTPELNAFYQAACKVAPGAWELLQDLLAIWQPFALVHAWKLPDGFDTRVKVMQKREARIEVDELDHATFTYEFYENEGSKTGISLPANVTHSVDGYVVREMHRRCNYNREVVEHVAGLIEIEMIQRHLGQVRDGFCPDSSVRYYRDQYDRSGLASAVILPYLAEATDVEALSTQHLHALASIVNQMLGHKPFELVTVHDEFKSHANNVNQVRFHYKEILAEIADSDVISDIMSQIMGRQVKFRRLSTNLGAAIRGSNYALT